MLKTIVKGCEPQLATKYSAAVDLFASEDVVIGAGETKIIGLGVCIDDCKMYNLTNRLQRDGNICIDFDDFKTSHYLELHPRSSLRAKGLIAGVGVIDLDFEQEIKIIIHNPLKLKWWNEKNESYLFPKVKSDTNYNIKKGDKLAQILLKEHKTYLMGITSDEERKGGIGSTDK